MAVKVTIVIPARNAEKTIAKTIVAIQENTYLPEQIIVVDGCSSDRTKDICLSFGVEVISNSKLHAASARNLGIENSKFPIVAFTDADCIPAKDWVERIVHQFESNPELDGVGGPVTLSAPKNQIEAFSASVFESIKSFSEDPVRITVKGVGGRSFAGANCAFSKSRVTSIGGFRDQFSNFGEEVDLLWRMVDAGSFLIFDPMICVEHMGYSDTIIKLIHTSYRNGIASTLLTKYHKRSPRIDSILYKKWFLSLLSTINPWRKDRCSHLLLLELSVFISAKWITSIKERTINL